MERSILQSPQHNHVAVNEMPITTQKCKTVQDGKTNELCGVKSLRKVTTAYHLQCLGPKEDVANVTVSSLEESGLNVSSDHVKSKESNLQQQNVNCMLEQEEITRYCEDGNPGQWPESTLSSLPLSESCVVKNDADYALKSIHYDKNVEPSTYTAVPNVHAEFHEVAVWSQDYLENCCSVSLVDKNNQALDETLLNEAVLNCCVSQSKETEKIEAVHNKKRKKKFRSRKTSTQKRKVPQKNELNENMTCERGGNVILEKSETEGNMQFHSEQGVEECHKSRKSEKKTDPREEHQTSKDTVSCEIENVEVAKHMKCSEEQKSVEVNDPEKSSYGNSTCNAKTTGVPTSEKHGKVHDGEIVSRNSKGSLLEQNNALCIENLGRAAQGERNEYRDLPKNDTRVEGVSLVVERKEIMYSQYCNVVNQTEVVSDSAHCDVGTQTEVESVSAQFSERQLIHEHNSGDVTNQLQQEASEHSGVSGVHTNEIVAAVEYEGGQCVEPTEQKGEMVKVGTSENSEQKEIALECKTGCDQGVAVSVTRDRRRKKCSQCNDCEENIKVLKKARSDRKKSEELTENKFKQLHSDSVVKDDDSRNGISVSKGTVLDDPDCKGVIEHLKPCASVKHARKVTDTENVSNKIKRYYTRSSKMSCTGDGSTRRKSTGDGSTRRKSTGDGSTRRKATGDGSTRRKATGDGSTRRKATGDGSTRRKATGDGSTRRKATGDGSRKKKSMGGGSRREKSTINCMENGGKLCSREESELSVVHENSENNITTLQKIGSSEVGDKQEQVYLRNEPLHKVKNHSAPYETAGALVPLNEYGTASDVGMIVSSDTLSECGKEEYAIQEKEICKQRFESAKDLHDREGNSIPQEGGAVLKQSMSQKELKHDSKSYQTEKETKRHHEEFYGNRTDLKPFQQQSPYIHEHTREAEHPKLHVDLRLAVMDDVADLNERNVVSDCLYAQHDAKENLTVIAYSITEEIIDTVLESGNTQQDDKLGNHEYIEKVPSEKTVCSGQEQQEKEVKCSENCGTWPQSDLRSRQSISLTRSHEDSEVPKDNDMFNTCTGSQKGSSLEQKCGEEKSLYLKEKETYDIIEKDPIKACGISQTVLENDTLQQEKTSLDDQEGMCIIHAVKVRKKSKLKSSRLRRKKVPHGKDKNVNNKDNETVVVKYEDQLELHSHQAVEDTEKYQQKYDQKGQQQSNYESKPEFSKVPLSHELGNLGEKCCEKENMEENLSEKSSENSECNVTYQMPLEKNVHLRNAAKVVPEETQSDAFCVKISEMFKDEHDLEYAENSIVEGGDSLVSKWNKMSMELPENQDSENYICENTCSQCSKTECDAVLENDSKLDHFEGKKMSKWESMEINCDKTECKREKLLNCRGKHDDGTGENPNKDYECQIIWEGSIVHLQEQPGFKLVKGGLREKNFTDDLKFCQSEMNSAHYTVDADDQCSRFGKMSETYDNSEGQPTEEMDKCIKNEDTYHGTEVSNLTECIESSGSGHDESECLISEQTQGVNVSEDLGRNCGISWMHDLEWHIKTEVLLDCEFDEVTESGNSFESSETLKCIDVKRNSPTAGCVNDECQIVWESSEAHHRQTPVVDVFDERQTKEHLPHDKDIKRKERGRIIKLKDMTDTNELGKIYEKLKLMQKTEIEENFKFCAGDIVKGKDLCSEHSKTEPWPKFENELPFPKQHTSHVIENNLQPHSNEGNSEKLASRKNVKKKSREFSVMSECKEVGMKSAKKGLVKEENGRQLNQGVKTDLSFQDTNVLEQACHSFPKYVGQTVYTENSDLRLKSSLGSGPPDCKTDYLNTDPAIECVAELPECKTDYLKKSVLYEGAELSKEYDRCIKPQEDSAVGYHSNIYLEHRGQNDIGSQTSQNNYSIQFSERNQLKHHKIKCETDVRYQQGQFSENDWETINSAKDSDYHENELKPKISAVSSVRPCASSSEDTTSSSCQLKECLKYLGGSEEAVCYEQSVDRNIKTTEDLQFTTDNVAAKKEYMSDQMSSEQQNGSDFINELQADEVQALSWEEKLLLEIYPEEEMDSHFENTNPVITSDVENLKKILPKHKDYCSANIKSSTSDSNGIEDLKTSGKIQLKGRSLENDMKDVINTRFQFLVQNAKNKVNPKNLLQYGRKYYDPYRYSKFSGKSTKVIGTRFNQGDPVISVNQEQNTFVESRVPWKMEHENPVYHGDKRQTDAIKATELQKTLKELECRIRRIEARKSQNCKSMKQLQNNEADPCMKFPKFESKSTSFGDRKLLESSSLERIGVRRATNSKNSEDYDRKVYNIVRTETKMGLPRGERNCKREVLVSKDNVNHVEFSGGQSDKSAFHELENKKVRVSEIDVLQRSKVSDENMKSSELHLLEYLQVQEESNNEVELHDNSKPKSLHIEVKCSTNSVNSFVNKKSKQEADTTPKNKVTRYQRGNLTWIVPDENLDSCDASEVKSTCTEPAGSSLDKECDHLKKDGEISSESENTGASNRLPQAQNNLGSVEGTEMSCKFSISDLRQHINKINSCGDFLLGTASSGCKYRKNHDTKCQIDYMNDFDDSDSEEKHVFSTGRYKTPSKPYWYSGEFKHHTERESASFPSKFKKLCYDHKTGSESVQVPRKRNKRDDFSNIPERVRFNKLQNYGKSAGEWVGSQRELEHGEHRQATFNKYSHVNTTQRFKKSLCRDCFDHDVSESKRESKEERTQFHKDKLKYSVQNLVRRQLEVISNHVEGKEKDFRQKRDHSSDGRVAEKKYSRECPEKLSKTQYGSFFPHDLALLQLKEIDCMTNKSQENTGYSSVRRNTSSPVSARSKTSRQDRSKKSPKLDLSSNIIEQLQSLPDVKKTKHFKLNRSSSWTRSDYDNFCDRKSTSSPKWMRKSHQSNSHSSKDKSHKEKQEHTNFSEKYLSHYQGKSSSKLSNEDITAVDSDEDSDCLNIYQKLLSQVYKTETYGTTNSGGTGKNKHKKRVLTDEGQVLKKMKLELTETSEPHVKSAKHGLITSGQDMKTPGMDREQCPHSSNYSMKAAGDKKNSFSEDKCLRNTTRKLKAKESVCNGLKKSKKREAAESRSPTKRLLSSNTMDQQVCPGKKAKSSHLSEVEQFLKNLSDGNNRQGDKIMASLTSVASDEGLQNAKKLAFKKDDGNRALNLPPQKMSKLCLDSDAEIPADALGDKDSLQPLKTGSIKVENKEQLPKHKNKASVNVPNKKCAVHGVCSSSKHESSVTHGEPSSLAEDKTESEKKNNLENLKDGRVDESYELLKRYRDLYSA